MTDHDTRRSTSLGYRISRLSRLNSCLLDAWLEKHGLCSGQIPYIISTVEKEGQTQETLSTLISVCPAATARMLKNMEASELVIRKGNPNNRRQKLVYPTEKAKELYTVLIPLLDTHNHVMFNGFSHAERVQARTMLDRIYDNVHSKLKEVKNT
ncbi:MarR family transcriptional regulator [Pseudodesulfovibrio sp. JC047]|uniref:MarR family winged helix-turn-helix transcriptional regulator n=1 Tax=Pseudodesulfovibrio sp. JC047 TaxID=2683199 RepID=UPI0013D28677|nr:MarR family transcriptional regulator [Pseudodesulfovibrio sp. JC047]NDV19375.1 MarR family transcriptional regulator [Pseudodesulfovibrio sp. JC047]